MNILIYMSGGFDVHGPSNHLFSTLIEDLLNSNHNVFLAQRFVNGQIDELSNLIIEHKNFHNYKIHHHLAAKNKLISRYFNSVIYAKKSQSVLRKLFANNVIDIVLVQSNPTPYFQLKVVRKIFKGPIVFNIQDLFPGSTIAAGKMKATIVQKFFYWFSRKAYEIADHITVISEDSRRLLVEKGIKSDKISVILNWYDSNSIREISWDNNIFVKKYSLKKDKFYVQYAGGMGFVFDYMAIIKVAKRFLPYSNVVFLMIGDGSQKTSFVNIASKEGLDNIWFFPMQPQSIVSDVYSSCDIQLIPLKRNIIGNSVPSKAALLMACNRLVVNCVDETSEYYSRFIENQIGISISNLDYDKLYDIIMDVYLNKTKYQYLVQNARIFAENFYSRNVNTKKYMDLFALLIERNSSDPL